MVKPLFPVFGPEADARKRLTKLEEQLVGLDEATQPDEFARINSLIEFEKSFLASFSAFAKERASKKRPPYSISAKGIFQLLLLAVVVFIVIGLKRHYLG
jgi:hypothetical protein